MHTDAKHIRYKRKNGRPGEVAYGVANAKLMDEQGKLQQIMIRKAGYESQARNLVNGTIDVPKIKECKRAVDTMKTMQRSAIKPLNNIVH